MKCKNIEVTGPKIFRTTSNPLRATLGNILLEPSRNANKRSGRGPLQGHSPKEFKPRWGSLYEDDADDEDEPEQDDDLQGAQDGDAEDGKRGKTDRKPGKGRKSGRKGGAWGAW